MRKFVLALALLVLPLRSTHATRVAVTGTLTDPQGTGINGTLVLQLAVQATDTTTNTLIVPVPVTYRLVNGVVTGSATINDTTNMQPQGDFYKGFVYDSRGTPLATYFFAVPPGAPLNMGQLVPTVVTTSNILYVTPASLTSGSNVFCQTNGMFVAGSTCYPTIQSAIAAAATTGSVLIPANYSGTDSYSNSSGVAVLDLRGNSNDLRVWSVISASRPTNLFPLGNDVDLFALGPADVHLANRDLQVTSSTSCTGAVQCTATVASPTLYGVAQGGNPTASFSTSAGLTLEPGTAAQESVASFTIGSGTTLVFTTVNNHTQPYVIRQQGTLFLDSGNMRVGPDATAKLPQFFVYDAAGSVAFSLNKNPVASFPLNAPQLVAVWTGGNGANNHVIFRNNTAASQFQILNAANTAQLYNLQEAGGGALVKFGNPTNVPLTFNAAQAAGGIVEGGGTSSVLRLAGVNTGTGTSGTIQFINNQTDLTVKASIDTSNGNLTAVGFASLGPVTVAALPAAAAGNKGFMITVSDSTAVAAEGQTCVGGSTNTALAFSNGTVWKCL